MNHYHHLALEEREEILRYSSQGCSIGQIAKLICRSKSTVSRELKRNASSDKKYNTVPPELRVSTRDNI